MTTQMKFNIGLVLAISLVVSWPSAAQEPLAIKGGKVITVSGDPIENGTVVIVDGKIVAVGTDVKIPVEAKVIDATGKVVMPGFVESHSSEAISQANETNPNVPYVSVLDGIDPMRPYFDEARRNGVTSVAVVPGNTTMIGGQAAVIKTGGEFVDYMLLKRNAGMKISLEPIGNSSRMGHLAALRKELDEAVEKLNAKEGKQEEGEEKEETSDDATGDRETGNEAEEQGDESGDEDDDQSADSQSDSEAELDQSMLDLVAGKLPAFIHCENAMDVGQALKLIEKYNLDAILVVDKDCYKAAKQIADARLPVILDSTLVFWESDPRTDEDKKVVLTEQFRDHDVRFAFQVARSNNNTLGNNYLWYQAATAVKYGMPTDEAIKALTLVPSEFLGIDKFVGSIEVGKDGDLVILTGDPLKIDTWVDTTIVNGQVVYRRDQDEKLKRLLGTESEN